MQSFSGKIFIPNFLSSVAGTESISQSRLHRQSYQELKTILNVACQVYHPTSDEGRRQLSKYFAERYNVRVVFSGDLLKVKYTVANFTELWQLAARGAVFRLVYASGLAQVEGLLHAPMKTFNIGEFPKIYQGNFTVQKGFYAETKLDGSLIVCGVDPVSGELVVTTSGSFAEGSICAGSKLSWRDVFLDTLSDGVVEWLNANPGVTLNCELISRNNVIVTQYDLSEGNRLYLLGAWDVDGMVLCDEKKSELDKVWIKSSQLRLPARFHFSDTDELDEIMTNISQNPTIADCDAKPEGVAIYDSEGYFIAKYKLDEYFIDHKRRSDDPGSHRDLLMLTSDLLEGKLDDRVGVLVPVQLDYVTKLEQWVKSLSTSLGFNVMSPTPSPLQLPLFRVYLQTHSTRDLESIYEWYSKLINVTGPAFRWAIPFGDTNALKEWYQWVDSEGRALDDALSLIMSTLDFGSVEDLRSQLLLKDKSFQASFAKAVNGCHKSLRTILFHLPRTTFTIANGWDLFETYIVNRNLQLPTDKPDNPPIAASSSYVMPSSSVESSIESFHNWDSKSKNGAIVFDFDGTLSDNDALIKGHPQGHLSPDTLCGKWFDRMVNLAQVYHNLGFPIFIVTGRRTHLWLELKSHLSTVLDFDFTLVMSPFFSGMKTSLYKVGVYKMLEFTHKKVLVVDDDPKIHTLTSFATLAARNGTIVSPTSLCSDGGKPTIVGLVGPPGFGKSSMIEFFAPQLDGKVVIIATDRFDQRSSRKASPLATLQSHSVQGCLDIVLSDDPHFVCDPNSRPYFDLLQTSIQAALDAGAKWIVIDSCNASMSNLKTFDKFGVNVKLFSAVPVREVQQGKKTRPVVAAPFAAWTLLNILTRDHINLDATKLNPSRIFSIWEKKATSSASIIMDGRVVNLLSGLNLPTDMVLNKKNRKLDTYFSTYVKDLLKGDLDGLIAGLKVLCDDLNVPSIEDLGKSILLNLSVGCESSLKKSVVPTRLYRAVAFCSHDFDGLVTGSHAVVPHLTLGMGGDPMVYTNTDLLGSSVVVELGDIHHATFGNGSWVTFITIDSLTHPLTPSHPHITLGYHDVHSNLGGGFMSCCAMTGHPDLKTNKVVGTKRGTKVVGVDVFLPSGLNTM